MKVYYYKNTIVNKFIYKYNKYVQVMFSASNDNYCEKYLFIKQVLNHVLAYTIVTHKKSRQKQLRLKYDWEVDI